MCFSAIVEQDIARLKRDFRAKPDLAAFKKLFERRAQGAAILIPKAMEQNFLRPGTDETAEIGELIRAYSAIRGSWLEGEVAEQRGRKVAAESMLAELAKGPVQTGLFGESDLQREKRAGQAAGLEEERRVASNWIRTRERQLDALRRRVIERSDSRVFQHWYASVVLVDNGERVIRPMRYLLRRAGHPSSDDKKYSRCYNARRDNLDRFWKHQFGHTHGIMVVTSFFENVSRHKMERRELAEGEAEENVVLQFDPQPAVRMHVACLYSDWIGEGEPDLLSMAAVTDEPPPEIAAVGHDRCIVPVSDANLDAWLNPEGRSSLELHAILDARERPYYEHRIAA